MQAGAVHALEDEDWIFPSYRESAIGLLRGMPPATVLHWWRGHPAGWWNPADYNVASICVPIATQVPHAAGLAWGKKLKGERVVATHVLRRRRDERGRVSRGRELRRRHAGAARSLLQQQPVGDLDADHRADACRGARRQGGRLRDARHAGRRRRRARRVRGDARGGRTRARRRRARPSSRRSRIAQRRTRPPTIRAPTSISSASSRRSGTSASDATSATCAGSASSATTSTRRSRTRPPMRCAPGIAEAEAEPEPDIALALRARVRKPACLVRDRSRRAAPDPGRRPWLSS